MYPHTMRVVLQTRDLLCYLLVTLGVTHENRKTRFLSVISMLLDHAASVVKTNSNALVNYLRDLRTKSLEALRVLQQWRKSLMEEAAVKEQEAAGSMVGSLGGQASPLHQSPLPHLRV